MKTTGQRALFVLAFASLLAAGQAMAVVVDFTAGEGYIDADVTTNANWNGGDGNIVSTGGAGYDGASGIVTMAPTNQWVAGIFSNAVDLDVEGDTITLSSRFQYSTTTSVPTNGHALVSLQFFDTTTNAADAVRVGLRRTPYPRLAFYEQSTVAQSPGVDETDVGLTFSVAGTSDWLELTAALSKGASSNDWTLTVGLVNLTTTNDLLSHTFSGVTPPANFLDDATVHGGFNSSRTDDWTKTTSRVMDTFGVEYTPPPVVIIGGSIGDGDFEAPEPAAVGSVWYTEHPNWFNASGPEGVGFSTDADTSGSPQPNSRIGMPYHYRKQVNNTGYTVVRAGVTFDLSYGITKWGPAITGDEAMRTFLFTSTVPVDGFLVASNDIVEFASVTNNYVADGVWWHTFTADGFYTTTESDIGKTFYYGMEHLDPDWAGGGAGPYPRMDLLRWEANENKQTIIRGATGDGDFEYPETPGAPGDVTGLLVFSNHPNWFCAVAWEGTAFSTDTQTTGSSQEDSRAAMPYQLRTMVNDAGYTVAAAGQQFDLSYEFGRMGSGYNDDEAMRTFLFTADVPVNGALAESNMTEFAEVIYTYPTTGFWTTFATNGFYTTTASDVGKTFYFGMIHLNPTGDNVFPRLDLVDLCVTLPDADACPAPLLYIVRNGVNVDVSWGSTDGCSYQLQTNDTLDISWGNYGSAVAGDGSTKTESIPAVGDTLNVRAEVQ